MPTDILLIIFNYLSTKEICKLLEVSKNLLNFFRILD
jgi:hypothetical protein